MKNIARSIISKICIHKVGTGINELDLRHDPIELLEDEENIQLTSDFLRGFNMEAIYQFSEGGNPDDIKKLVNEYFAHSKDFQTLSEDLAHEWVNITSSPTDSGELIVCQFEHLSISKEESPGIGIFFVRSKEKFLQINRNQNQVHIKIGEGVNVKKITECVLMLPGKNNNPVQLFFKENTYEFRSHFFVNQFIKATPVHNNYYNTSNHINLLKAYVDEEMTGEDPLKKIEKLNRSKEYFRNHDVYNQKDYGSTIFEEPEHIALFEKFRDKYAMDKNIYIADEFEISPHALNRNMRRIRSVIKLDKNFHIYVHGDRKQIIRGYDPARGKHFYQLFFDEEN
jgi:hypothetical protein